jgi:hypothetical protein
METEENSEMSVDTADVPENNGLNEDQPEPKTTIILTMMITRTTNLMRTSPSLNTTIITMMITRTTK